MKSANSYVNRINHYADLDLFALALRKPIPTKSYSLTLFCKGNCIQIMSSYPLCLIASGLVKETI